MKRVYVITGGGSGMGLATIKELGKGKPFVIKSQTIGIKGFKFNIFFIPSIPKVI